ncbi:MAG: hypothetical protein ACFCD0_24335 [Gemmataceae bacterium]
MSRRRIDGSRFESEQHSGSYSVQGDWKDGAEREARRKKPSYRCYFCETKFRSNKPRIRRIYLDEEDYFDLRAHLKTVNYIDETYTDTWDEYEWSVDSDGNDIQIQLYCASVATCRECAEELRNDAQERRFWTMVSVLGGAFLLICLVVCAYLLSR